MNFWRRVSILLLAFIMPILQTQAAPECETKLQEKLKQLQNMPVLEYQALYDYQRDVLLCEGHLPAAASFIGQVSADLQIASRNLVERRITQTHFLEMLADRRIKLEKYLADPAYREAYSVGDADRDLVPDTFDSCSKTTVSAPTDHAGCDYNCENLEKGASKIVTAQDCKQVTADGPMSESLQQLMSTSIPLNIHCTQAKTPSGTAPLGWFSGTLEHTVDSPGFGWNILGLKLFALRSPNRTPDCELFYEFEIRFMTPEGDKAVRLVFSETEMISAANPDVAVFELRTRRNQWKDINVEPRNISVSSESLPLSPGQSAARDGFYKVTEVTWRVRAVNGVGLASEWSPFRTHKEGPDLSF